MPKKMAQIKLLPARFQIEGPSELIALTQVAASSTEDPEEAKWAVMEVWADWYVTCSISNERVSLRDLCYWDVEKNEIYARPELVPALGWYVPLSG